MEWTEASSDAKGISTAEWCGVYVKNKFECIGKWGHSVVAFQRSVPQVFHCNSTCTTEDKKTSLSGQVIAMSDDNANNPPLPYAGKVQDGESFKFKQIYPDGCGLCTMDSKRSWKDNKVPTLFFIAGNSAGAFKTRDIFHSSSGCRFFEQEDSSKKLGFLSLICIFFIVLCERGGIICANRGVCTLGGGCFCNPGAAGEFCNLEGPLVYEDDSRTLQKYSLFLN